MSTATERLAELKELLKECDYVIHDMGAELQQDIKENEKKYQEHCHKVEEAQKESKRVLLKLLSKARREGYTRQQVDTLKRCNCDEPVEFAEERRNKCFASLQKRKTLLRDYPEYRRSALADRPYIVAEIQSLEKQLYGHSTTSSDKGSTLIGLIVIVILFFVLKSCVAG